MNNSEFYNTIRLISTHQNTVALIVIKEFIRLKKSNNEYTEIFEVKPETAIDRSTGKAHDGALRFTERVVAGTKFIGTITLKVFAEKPHYDNEEEFIKLLIRGLQLLELDALGGSSSRGYGKVSILFDGKELPELV